MRPLLLALLATLLLAAPASAARFQHSGADIDFTVGASDNVRVTAAGHKLGDPKQLTFARGTGGTAFSARCGLLRCRSGLVTCGVSDDTRLRFTTNERADVIDASGTDDAGGRQRAGDLRHQGRQRHRDRGPAGGHRRARATATTRSPAGRARTSCAATPATTASPA